jgi:glycosyltransferase involved in cell wall biosynthesis
MGRYVRALVRQLARRRDVVLTLLARDARHAAAYRAIVGAAIHVAPLSAAHTRGAFDLVWYPWNGIRFGARAPAVVTINDDFAFAYPARGFIARRREQRPISRAVATAARIVTISAWSRRTLLDRFGLAPDRLAVLPLVPDAYFVPGPETAPFAQPFVLAVGAAEERKNVTFLTAVVERAFPARDVRLVVVGTPPRTATTRPNAAIWLAGVNDSLLRRLYRTAAVVAVPSLAEGFGLVAAEAAACGAAVIAANTSALPEAVGQAGMLLDPHDAPGWERALRALLSDAALRAEYRARSRARWSDASVDGTVDALMRAFEFAVHDRA